MRVSDAYVSVIIPNKVILLGKVASRIMLWSVTCGT